MGWLHFNFGLSSLSIFLPILSSEQPLQLLPSGMSLILNAKSYMTQIFLCDELAFNSPQLTKISSCRVTCHSLPFLSLFLYSFLSRTACLQASLFHTLLSCHSVAGKEDSRNIPDLARHVLLLLQANVHDLLW